MKWAAQLPDEVISKVDDAYIDKMSNHDTLVLVGDIRRSQDLMTYGAGADTYIENIIEFMNTTRQILKRNCGLYDRLLVMALSLTLANTCVSKKEKIITR